MCSALARAGEPVAKLVKVPSRKRRVFGQDRGKIDMSQARSWLPLAMDEMRCQSLALNLTDAIEAALLPLHHRDPFDRLIVAQARVERLTLVTADRTLRAYHVEILRA